MVNKKQENEYQDDLEITNEETELVEPDLEDIEEKEKVIISSLREKLKNCEASKRDLLEETQRIKADFLNARKRLDEEKDRDRERMTIGYIESLLPLCDSFQMAMANKEVWEKAEEKWRKGIEGIYAQLQNILSSFSVKTINPTGEHFDPKLHDALSTIAVDNEKDHDRIISVVQLGYELVKGDGTTEQIRPARVVIGLYEKD